MKSKLSANLSSQVFSINAKTGGATLTRVARSYGLKDLVCTCRGKLNIQIRDLRDLKPVHIQKYVAHCKEQGLSSRTLQNRLAHIRTALTQLKDPMGNSKHTLTSNKALGISGASRSGTHRPAPPDLVAKACEALAVKNPGAAAGVELQRSLGLRAREVVQCSKSLANWQKSLEQGRPIQVIHGTKGGRHRESLPTDSARALAAVRFAREVVKLQGGQLIESSTLRGAAQNYGRALRLAGLGGELASHSLRYAYTVERFEQLEPQMGREEALAMLSLDLGHGDGRGKYVAKVYLNH